MMLDWKAGLCCISRSMVCLPVKPDRERRAEREEPRLGQGSHGSHLQTFYAKGIYPKEKTEISILSGGLYSGYRAEGNTRDLSQNLGLSLGVILTKLE